MFFSWDRITLGGNGIETCSIGQNAWCNGDIEKPIKKSQKLNFVAGAERRWGKSFIVLLRKTKKPIHKWEMDTKIVQVWFVES